jgi:hypothetical protein
MSEMRDDCVKIPDETRLFRRIDPHQVVYDKDRKERRPTSQNFNDSKDGSPMSVFAENVANASGEAPEVFLRGRWIGWYLAAVRAGAMRQHGQQVYLDPHNQDPEDCYSSHAAVEGRKDTKTRSKLARDYEWVIAPPDRYAPEE